MAEEAKKKNNKNLIIGICAGILVIAVIVVAIIFATRSTTTLNDAYFVSDNTKYVLTVDEDAVESDEETAFKPIKTHVVYNYSDDTITSMTTYMEFADEATAKQALAYYQEAYADTNLSESGIANISTNGKYLVILATSDQYADMTASDVKQYIEFMEMVQNTDIDELENTENNEVNVVETDNENEE